MGTRLTEEQHAALVEAASASRTAFAIIRRTYEIGAADYIALLDTEQKMYANEDAADGALYDRVRAAIDLYKALGGGMRGPDSAACAA